MTDLTVQKSIALALDAAANRACLVEREGATRKQVWFLAGLIAKAGRDESDIGCEITNTQAVLTKRQASIYIDDYLNDAAKAA